MISNIPSRLDLAGGWLDQPWVSMYAPGPVIVFSIESNDAFYGRGGMASSTRDRAIRLWGKELPRQDPIHLAEVLFAYDNMPGCEFISGSQDALGVCMPGVNYLWYDAKFWPSTIITETDYSVLLWLERRIRLLPLGPRPNDFSVLSRIAISGSWVQKLSQAACDTWEAIIARDADKFASSVFDSFMAQCAIFPLMVNPEIMTKVGEFRDRGYGVKITGAGGGGFLVLITEDDVPGSIQVKCSV